MKVLVVYWHPEPQSFNGAMFRTACETLARAGHEVKTSDLQEMNFNPVSGRDNFTTVNDPNYFKQQTEEMHATEMNGFAADIESEIEKLEWCDLLILQFPLWWFGLPAVLKGWVDRVFAMGRTYCGGRIYEDGVYRGKRVLLSLTTGGPEEGYSKGVARGDMTAILLPIHRSMLFVGFDILAPQLVYGPVRMTDEEREQQLATYDERLQNISDEPAIITLA